MSIISTLAVSGGPQALGHDVAKKPALWAVRSTGLLGAGSGMGTGTAYSWAGSRKESHSITILPTSPPVFLPGKRMTGDPG